MSDNSAEEKEIAHFRLKASEEAAKMKNAFEASKTAFENGRKAEAKELSNKGKEHKRIMDEMNQKASDLAFKLKNNQNDETVIDLHGLYVQEAMNRLNERVNILKNKLKGELTVITGKGLHSQGDPKIKEAVVKYAEANNILHDISEKNPGRILFHFTKKEPGTFVINTIDTRTPASQALKSLPPNVSSGHDYLKMEAMKRSEPESKRTNNSKTSLLTDTKEPRRNRTKYYIGIGLAVGALAGLILYFALR